MTRRPTRTGLRQKSSGTVESSRNQTCQETFSDSTGKKACRERLNLWFKSCNNNSVLMHRYLSVVIYSFLSFNYHTSSFINECVVLCPLFQIQLKLLGKEFILHSGSALGAPNALPPFMCHVSSGKDGLYLLLICSWMSNSTLKIWTLTMLKPTTCSGSRHLLAHSQTRTTHLESPKNCTTKIPSL